MKIAYRLFLVLLISTFLFSCTGKKAGIEGKLQNGQGQPISSITVTFQQVQPSKGYEQFETKTLADGSFRIDGVMPAAEYIITPISDNWKTKVTIKITTLAAGQTLVLSSPIVIRFNALKDGTVVDTKTGLQWLILGIPNLNSSNVLNAVKNIKEGGFNDWRLPTKTELSELTETPSVPPTPSAPPIPSAPPTPSAPAVQPAKEATSAPTVQTESASVQKTCCVWVTELNSEIIEWKFYVDNDNDVWASSKVPPDDRIVIVRNYTPAAPSTPTPVAAIPASGTTAPSANLTAEKKPVPEPAPPGMGKKDIPAVKSKSEDGALKASRKADTAKKDQTAKSSTTEASPFAAAPVKQSPSAKAKLPPSNNTMGDSITIEFAINKSDINPEELTKLKSFYAKNRNKKGTILIEGHSDSGGDSNDRFKTSGERAVSVKTMLYKLGLDKKANVKITGLSETKPIADNTTEAGRKLNRRATVTFIPE
jgi:outer membrane protein OmpA-like peptidoglycan-associated protein